jgi:CHAT domain-containing protein/tetratricopeptide (TPR) repeat protein
MTIGREGGVPRAAGTIGLALLVAGLAGLATAQPLRLEAGRPVERPLASGESHSYVVTATRGQFFDLRVEQIGIDVVLELSGPGDQGPIRVDTPVGSAGEERACFVADRGGEYTVHIGAFDPEVIPGRYRITLREVRPSTSDEAVRLRAQSLFLLGQHGAGIPDATTRREAVERFQRAAAAWRAVGDRRQEGLAIYSVAIVQRNLGDLRPAAASFRAAAEAAHAGGDEQLRGKALDGFGYTLVMSGEHERAFVILNQALELLRAARDRQGEADCLRHRGEAFWRQGQYQKALDDYQPALSIAVELHDRGSQAWAWNALGLAYTSMGELDKALDQFSRAVPLARAMSDPISEAFSRQNMGYAFWRLGAYEKALESFEAVLPSRRAAGEKQLVALLIDDIGLVHLSMGQAELARSNFQEALAIWTAQGDERSRVLAFLNLGLAEQRLHRAEQAMAWWAQARDLASRLGMRDHQAAALGFLARADADRGDLDRAREEIEAALVLLERARGEIQFSPLRASYSASKQDIYDTELDILLRLHERSPGRGFDAEAFRASERGRAREMTEAVLEAHADISEDLPEDLRRRETEIGERIRDLEKGLAMPGAGGSDYENRLVEAEEDWSRLVAEMRRRTPLYATLRYPEPVSVRGAAALLDAETALVSFSVDARRGLVFVLAGGQLIIRKLSVSPDDLAERVENYVGLVAREERGRRVRQELGERLYGDLIAPWRDRLPPGIRHLILLPDGVLDSLPFEALERPGPPPRRLIDDFVVSYAPSATVLALLEELSRRGESRRGPAEILVLADPGTPRNALPSPSGLGEEPFDLSPLPFAAAEGRVVARFGAPGSQLRLGEDAAASREAQRAFSSFRVLHFATHGLLSRRVPSRSALLLSAGRGENRLLTAREIHRLRLKSDMVVLSACQTARGRILAGEGVESLARAFFHAGASSVVASLWDVSDRRTTGLMESFYEHLARGETKAVALRSAKLDLLRREPGLAPRYWAPFVLLGDPGGTIPLVRARAVSGWTVAGVLGVMLVPAAFWTVRRRRLRAPA